MNKKSIDLQSELSVMYTWKCFLIKDMRTGFIIAALKDKSEAESYLKVMNETYNHIFVIDIIPGMEILK